MITYSDVTMSYSNTLPPIVYKKSHTPPGTPHSTTGTVLNWDFQWF